MNNQSKSNFLSDSILKNLISELERGIKLIESLPDEIYQKKTYGVGSIGSHFRHNLDFIENFLKGLGAGKIDYSRRQRDIKVETKRDYAVGRFSLLIEKLQNTFNLDTEKEILVSSELNENAFHRSSVSRELEFLHSHTIHHFALIAEKLNSFGYEVSGDFGVAPSTLKFWSEQNSGTGAAA